MTATEIIERINNRTNSEADWHEIADQIAIFMKEDHPESEKRKFWPLGYGEVVAIICDGYNAQHEYERGILLYEHGQYKEAYECFSCLGSFRDAQEYTNRLKDLML